MSRHVPSHRGRQQLNDVSLQKLIKNNDSARPTWGFVWPGWGNCRGTALLRKQCPQLSSEQWCASLDFLVMPWNNTHTHSTFALQNRWREVKKNRKKKGFVANQKTLVQRDHSECITSVIFTCQISQLLSPFVLCGDNTNLQNKTQHNSLTSSHSLVSGSLLNIRTQPSVTQQQPGANAETLAPPVDP